MFAPRTLATLLIRIIAVVWITFGLWALLAQLITSLHQVDWVYIDLYLTTRLASPILAILIGVILWKFSSTLGRHVSRHLGTSGN